MMILSTDHDFFRFHEVVDAVLSRFFHSGAPRLPQPPQFMPFFESLAGQPRELLSVGKAGHGHATLQSCSNMFAETYENK